MIKDLQAIKEIEVLPLEESMKILRGIEAEEQEQAGPEPVVVITIWNGLLEDVECNVPAKVIVLEHDKYVDPEQEYPDAWAEWGGYKYWYRKWNLTARAKEVAEVVADIGGLRD